MRSSSPESSSSTSSSESESEWESDYEGPDVVDPRMARFLYGTPPPPGPDRLSALPTELLSMIFDALPNHIYFRRSSNSLLLSKTLLPFTMKRLYRSVVLTCNYRQVSKFVASLQSTMEQGGLPKGSYVKSLSIEFRRSQRNDQLDFDPSCIRPLFGLVPRLKRLCIVGSMYLLNDFLSESNCHQLESLTVDGLKLEHGRSLLDLATWKSLQRFPTLSTFDIRVDKDDFFPSWEPFLHRIAIEKGQRSPLPNVTTLRVSGHLASNRPLGLRKFLRAFSQLTDLTLSDTSGGMCISRALERVSSTLEVLSISRVPSPLLQSVLHLETGIDNAHAHFPSLKKLTLFENILHNNSYATLHNFTSLETLHLHDESVTATQLNALANPATKPPKLQNLRIKNCHVSRGDDLDHLSALPDTDELENRYYWRLPTWTDDLSHAEASRFVFAAGQVGIYVDGALYTALEVEEALADYAVKFGAKRRALERKLGKMDAYWKEWSSGMLARTRSRDEWWKRWSQGEVGRVRK